MVGRKSTAVTTESSSTRRRGFKLRGQAGHAYRIPTYTDLYYEDPVSKGNSNLLPENVWNYEAGADWYSDRGTTVSLTWFQREENNTIDWVRQPGGQKFHARNFAELTFHGGEGQVRQRLGSSEIGVNYTVMRASKVPTPGVTSRYVFNFPLNSLSVSYHGSLNKYLAVKMRLGAFNRTWQSTKALWDTSLIYTAGRWRPFFQVSNLLDQSYEALAALWAKPRVPRVCGVRLIPLARGSAAGLLARNRGMRRTCVGDALRTVDKQSRPGRWSSARCVIDRLRSGMCIGVSWLTSSLVDGSRSGRARRILVSSPGRR